MQKALFRISSLPIDFHRSFFAGSLSHNVNVARKEETKHVNYRTFPEQRVRIETCGRVYDEWWKRKRFTRIPEGDLTFDVRYVDTLYDGNEKPYLNGDSAVVLALHGAPGSYQDYGLLTSFLYERGIRVIAPCFPDFSDYPPGVFRHSATEKAQFIKDFLKAIDVRGIDTLIAHSSAVYPSLQLCFENQMPKINSLALFNPASYTPNMRATTPFRGIQALVRFCETKAGFEIYKRYGKSFLILLNTVVRIENVMGPLLSATTMVYADIPKSRQLLHDLSLLQFPIFMVFSEDDKMIQKELSYNIAYKLGLLDPQIGFVNKNGEIVNEGKTARNMKAIAFENGSHYVFWKYPQIVHEQLYSFMEKHVL